MTARLAVVDDDSSFTDFLGTFLKSRGYEVDTYHSGTELLQNLRSGATPQVVLLDVAMPDLDGIETLKAIRHAQPSAQVIMLSGRQTPATIIEAVRLGAADYVLKPGDPDGVGEAALESAIRNALERESLNAEVQRLSTQLAEDPNGIQPTWGSGAQMQQVMAMVERVADSDVSVLLRGESGVGKEVIAHELHRRSSRRTKPFVKVNCAALPGELLESELFGHERGAFTGAGSVRVGRFEYAQHGTIMMDEIGEMAPALQAKMMHVLQDREFTRLGSNRTVEVDVRVLAATNRDLEAMMRSGTFREDLYYRLQVIEIWIPPLRDRREEIPPLVEFFIIKFSKTYRRPTPRPSKALAEALVEYHWPGNIRELENMMKRLVVLQEERLILDELTRLRQIPLPTPPDTLRNASSNVVPMPAAAAVAAAPPPPATEAVDEAAAVEHDMAVHESDDGIDLQAVARSAAKRAERAAIEQALDKFRWNRRKAAEYLKVSYKTLLNKMKECGISDAEAS